MNLRDLKMLWGRSANRCALCKRELTVEPIDPADTAAMVGDMAHIVARKPTFTRGDFDEMSEEDRETYHNRILLCKIDHKRIDDQPAHFTVDRLRAIKTEHERWVRDQLSGEELQQQRDDELYAAYVQDFLSRIEIDRWTVRGTWICSDDPEFDAKYYDRMQEIGPWLLSRLWPRRYADLEEAFVNFQHVLADLLRLFSRHAEFTPDRDRLITTRFYRSDAWLEQAEYHARVKKYEEHTALVQDLFFELTRALNYICDLVRTNLSPSFRANEGAVLVERGPVGFNRIEYSRPEYRGAERTARPYPGLAAFENQRYTRDCYVKTAES